MNTFSITILLLTPRITYKTSKSLWLYYLKSDVDSCLSRLEMTKLQKSTSIYTFSAGGSCCCLFVFFNVQKLINMTMIVLWDDDPRLTWGSLFIYNIIYIYNDFLKCVKTKLSKHIENSVWEFIKIETSVKRITIMAYAL